MKRAIIVLIATLALAVGALTAVQAASAQPGECGKTGRKAPEPLECGTKVTHAAVNEPDGIFLCYSKFQTDPGVWMQDQAAELLAAGYWYPNALPGNVEGGTNVGSFHLVCNASGTPTGKFVDENGEVVSPDDADHNLGHYPQFS